MIHLGDIRRIDGASIPPVDLITGGSPCQDLSVAGNRRGLDGERSCLFREQMRIIHEMRRATRGRSPRWMVWENVPGALSTNGGRDFLEVVNGCLHECERHVFLPMPYTWSGAGALYSDLGSWSLAWRIHDAQFWGVPQRRRRIALVVDFGGNTASEVLFERKGGAGPFAASGKEGIEVAGCGEKCLAVDCRGSVGGIAPTITGDHNNRVTDTSGLVLSLNASERGNGISATEKAHTLKTTTNEAAFLRCGTIRRFTPLECERLQGYPDNWTQIGQWTDARGRRRECSDALRYRAIGNSIALPFWRWLLHRIHAAGARRLGSLFDGIGGFPLCWEGDRVWASEVDPFCIAVTTAHFS